MSILRRPTSQRKAIQHSDPGKILDLVMSLNDETCAPLQMKINTYLAEECEAETVLLIVVQGAGNEAFIEAVGATAIPRKLKICMTHKLCEILKSSTEQTDALSHFGADFQAIVTPHISKDSIKKRIVMFPVADQPFSIIVCVVAPKVMEETVACIIHECFLFCWPVLRQTVALEYECTLKQKCQQLLRVARRLFSQVASLSTLLRIAMGQAKQLTKAEHCSVLLVDIDNMELVNLTYNPGKTNNDNKEPEERRFPMNIGITGQVINTGNLVNAKNVKEHPAFHPDIDCLPGVDCKSLLCFPIREQTGIIGVGILINKIGDPYFDAMDEEMALAFSIYCGVCIMHSVVYQKIQEAHIRNALANELVMYHMQVGDSEVLRLLDCSGYHSHPHLSSLHFNLRALPLRELPCYVLKMFSELGYDKRFNIKKQKLARFVLHVKKGYRDVPYHSWLHAFSVAQWAFAALVNYKLVAQGYFTFNIKKQKLARFVLHVKKGYRDVPYHSWLHAFSVAQWAFAALVNYKLVAQGYFTELQGLMYFIAGLVHDMDHRGTTNSFQISGQTTLAALYSSEGSVMERHHLAQAMCVLNTEGCDILESLPRRDYDRAIMLLRDYILATDLANYFKNLGEFRAIAMDFQKGNRLHTSALQSLLMNAADLSDQLKDWGSVKKTAAAVLTEFFKQGELEKSRGELPPSIMDRDKCFIPDLEIQFLNMTCIPLFDVLGKIIPKATHCLKVIEGHIEKWDAAKPIFAEVPITAGLSVLLSPELDNLIEQNLREKERQRLEAEAAEDADA